MNNIEIIKYPLYMNKKGYIGKFKYDVVFACEYQDAAEVNELVKKYRKIYGKTHYVTYRANV